MATADLTLATRELFDRTKVDEVYMKTPFVEELKRRNQVSESGGKTYEFLATTDSIESLMQEYTANTALTDGKKTTLKKPSWSRKYAQLPLRYDVDEQLQNINAGTEEQLLDLAADLTERGNDATRRWLCAKVFNSGSTTGVADGATGFQSLVSALDSDVTYGGITRTIASTVADWWQGADPSNLTSNITASTQATATNLTKANLRKWINETDVSHYMEGADDLMVLMCPTLWDKLAAEMEAAAVYKSGMKQSQGIRSMMFDGHEIVSVPYLQTSSTMKTWLFIINLKYWKLMISSQRNFKMTDFKWQGENSNGYDFYLARILIAGNLICKKPNSSMWLSNVS